MKSNIIKYVENELNLVLDKANNKEKQADMNNKIKEIVKLMASQGHTLYTVHYVLEILSNLLFFKPLTPLLGTKEEFNEGIEKDGYIISENKRYAKVIKKMNKETGEVKYYNTLANIFYDGEHDNGWFIIDESIEEIEDFPYMPVSKYIILKHPISEISVEEQLLKGDYIEKTR